VLEGYATLPGGERKWLIRIPAWDPNWQGVYTEAAPLFLPKGTVVSMRWHYDNSAANPRNPHQPPQRVRAGNRATDEMSHLWLEVLPRSDDRRDHRLELEEALMRHRLEKYPDDFMGNFRIGMLRLARLDSQGALDMLETAVRIQPDHAEARNLLGTALTRLGRSADAIVQFRLALRYRPGYMNAEYNLARALARTGAADEAIASYRRILIALPQDTAVHNELGELYLSRQEFALAIGQFDETLAIDPRNETAHKDREAAVEAGASPSDKR
jgi:tetratricopeptide (TPR) repeat protein